MPEDTKYIVNQSQLTAIGSAIRSKLGKQDLYTVDQMPTKIRDISAGGGGGGSLNNPVLTVNVVATGVSGEIGALPLLTNNNGILQIVNEIVQGGSSYSYETIITETVYSDESFFEWNVNNAVPEITGTSRTLSTSNAVNCQINLDQANNFFYVAVEDPAQPASFTLTIS